MKYKDLSVRIDKGPEGYRVRAEFDDPQVGSGAEAFELPDGSAAHHRSLANAANMRSLDDEVSEGTGSEGDPVAFGVDLFHSLFRGNTLKILNKAQALADASADEGQFGLRLRLQFDLSEEGTADVAGLPWELVRPSADDPPFAVSQQMSLVRYLEGTEGRRLLELKGQLRVMLVVSSPSDVPALEGEQEAADITAHLGTLIGIQAKAFPATKEGLSKGLSEFKPHVLHYIGHGTQGALVLEDEQGKRADFSGDLLQPLITGQRDLRLVFLNACDTGATGGLSPWEGPAASIFRVGLPAVIAMQFPIHDDAAKEFAGEFYSQVARGEGMEAALSGARRKLHGSGHSDWSTPVMFLRDEDEGRPPPNPLRTAREWGERVLAPVLALLATAPWLFGWPNVPGAWLDFGWRTPLPLAAAGFALTGLIWAQRLRLTPHIWVGLTVTSVLGVWGLTNAKQAFDDAANSTILRVVLNPRQMFHLTHSPGKADELIIDFPTGPDTVVAYDSAGTLVIGPGDLTEADVGYQPAWDSTVDERLDEREAQDSKFDYALWEETISDMPTRIRTRLWLVHDRPIPLLTGMLTARLASHKGTTDGLPVEFTCVPGAVFQGDTGRNIQDCFLLDVVKND